LTPREPTPSEALRLNFYTQPDACIGVLASLLREDKRTSIYVQSFGSASMPSIQAVLDTPPAERTRPARKVCGAHATPLFGSTADAVREALRKHSTERASPRLRTISSAGLPGGFWSTTSAASCPTTWGPTAASPARPRITCSCASSTTTAGSPPA